MIDVFLYSDYVRRKQVKREALVILDILFVSFFFSLYNISSNCKKREREQSGLYRCALNGFILLTMCIDVQMKISRWCK